MASCARSANDSINLLLFSMLTALLLQSASTLSLLIQTRFLWPGRAARWRATPTRLAVALRVVARMAVHVKQILGMMDRLKLLPVAPFFVLRVGQVLGAGHPLG